eukprot:CAMPEP_0204304590 /NCGR_PEP_ID=MMETSP0468-20130131/84490_1 /ASSEMBLY_ACC=CAM_ASM_000383 /TAXON_ID=2969 /ORGANISM="Oxyrrhis marina" /LENGTH=665 /DNA_ID=CAMNT_0051283915 /DNA_START=68 /DNA_END=2065 /DNA_ORIENTATION=+
MKLICRAVAFAGCSAIDERPITKVVKLLQDMKSQLEAEEKKDEETYHNLACWCETNDKAKTEAIKVADSRITDLVAATEEGASYAAQLEVELEQHHKEVDQGKQALSQARSQREQAADEWYSTEKDLVQSIAALKNAIQVLSKQHGGESLLHVSKVLRFVMDRRADSFAGLSQQQHSTLTQFLQQPASAGSYNSQSGEIFGILRSMLEEMEKDLEEGRTSETQDKQQYQDMKFSKTEENDAGKKAIATKKQELATTREKLENNKEDLDDTRAALSADTKFLSDLKLRCQSTDKEYSDRVAERQTEISAVSDAISMLTDDDNVETMTRAMNFLQTASQSSRAQKAAVRGRAATLLLQVAAKTGNRLIAALAAEVETDVFAKVKKAIDDMTAQLKKEMEEEVKHRDFCVSELDVRDKEIAKKEREAQEFDNRISDLQLSIEEFSKEIQAATKEIAETKVQIKKAGMNREAENADFQATINDQRETQDLLHKVMTRLAVVYGKTQEERLAATGASSLAQQEPGAAAPPPPPGFEKKQKNKGSTGVLSMIEGLIDDSKKVEADAVAAEREAQSDYESFVSDSNDSISRQQNSITNKSEAKARAEEELSQAKADYESTQGDIERLHNVVSDLHNECDFTLKNFETRQKARQDELDGMAQAKAILSGASFD